MAATLHGMQPEIRVRVEGVLREAKGELYLSEGFRTKNEQLVFWRKYLNGGPIAARPGTSDHERGKAADIAIKTDRGYDLRENLCKKWGLIDNVRGEKWHRVLDPKRGPVPYTGLLLPAPLPSPPKEDEMTPETIVAVLPTPTGAGAWKLQYDGGIVTVGDAQFYGCYWNLRPEHRLGNRGGFVSLWPYNDGYRAMSADGSGYGFDSAEAKRLSAAGLLK